MRRRRKLYILFAGGVAVTAVLVAVGLWLRGPRYEVIDLGTLGGASACAMSVNNVGQVVGWSKTRNTGSQDPDHAFLWDEEHGMRDLGTLGGANSWAHDINDKGQVVGYSDMNDGTQHAFLWDADKGMIDLGTLGGGKSEALSINNKGQIVGCAETAEGQNHAFLWAPDGGMVDLGGLYGGRSVAKDINEKGQVVGLVVMGRKDHAFYWDSETGMVDLVGANGPSSVATGINNAGRIVGFLFNAQKNNYDACIWSGADGVETFNVEAVESYGGGINDRGQVIGYVKEARFFFFGAPRYYFLRTATGRIIDLDRYAASDDEQFQACGINDAGWIVGDIGIPNKSGHRAALLRPQGSGKPASTVRQGD